MAGPATSTISTVRRQRHRRRIVAAIGVATLAISGCGGADENSAAPAAEAPADLSDGEFETAVTIAGDSDSAATQTGGAAQSGLPLNDFGRDIITNVSLTMSTNDVAQATDDVRRLATANGGAVFSSDVTIGDEQDDGSVPGGGVIVVRIPPDDLDGLVTALDGVGVVSRLAQDSQDVTDQLVDLDVRIRQAEASVERVELLLAEATELGEVFAIEKELTTRQITLEQLLATQRNTQDLVDLATLTVQVEYRTPDELEAIEQGDGIGDGFSSGWDAFVASVFAIAYVLAIGAPFLLTATAIGGVAWALSRRRAHQRAELREQRRLDADRLGPVIGAGAGQYPSPGPTSPPPPNASERSADAQSQTSPSDSVATTAVAAPIEGVAATDEEG